MATSWTAGLESAQRMDWLWVERMHHLFGSCQEFWMLPGSPWAVLWLRIQEALQMAFKTLSTQTQPPSAFPTAKV